MAAADTAPRTPLSTRVDRSDERIRLIEEAVLLIRGEWPAVACGLCEMVNRETGLIITLPDALDQAIEETAEEAMGIVERLYGRDAAVEVRRRAGVAQSDAPSTGRGVRRRGGHSRRPLGTEVPARLAAQSRTRG
jgi:hypothetical protein